MDATLIRLLQLAGISLTESITGIEDANSSGQGRYPDYDRNPYHDILKSHGYAYSHTTPINGRINPSHLHHTYRHLDMKDHVVGINAPILRMGDRGLTGKFKWEAGKSGSNRYVRGEDAAQLDRFLKSHVRRAKPKVSDPY